MVKNFEGVIVPVVTPFDINGGVDIGALSVILEFLLENGVNGIMPLGSQGEFYALTTEEKHEIINAVIKQVQGRTLIVIHVGEISTNACIDLAQFADVAGADAVSIITPFYISPNQVELFDHYRLISEAVDIPVFAYNNPGRSGVNILPITVAHLAEQVKNFIGIKDSSGNLEQTGAYVRYCPKGFHTFVGRDLLIYGSLMYGAVGAVASTANVVPDIVVGIYRAYQAGDYERAKKLQEVLALLREAYSLGTFPCVVKDAMNLIGLPAGSPRLPVQNLEKTKREELSSILSMMRTKLSEFEVRRA